MHWKPWKVLQQQYQIRTECKCGCNNDYSQQKANTIYQDLSMNLSHSGINDIRRKRAVYGVREIELHWFYLFFTHPKQSNSASLVCLIKYFRKDILFFFKALYIQQNLFQKTFLTQSTFVQGKILHQTKASLQYLP